MERVLTIVGASARAAAQSAVRAGFRVCAGDLFSDVDLCRAAEATRVDRYPAGLASVVAGPQAGPWMYTGALENHPALVAALAQARPLWGNDGDVLRRVRNPLAVATALAEDGIPCPAVATRADRLASDKRWLIKPRSSAGGGRIALFDRTTPRMRLRGGRYYQQFIEGAAHSAVYVAARRQAVLIGITRQLIGMDWTGASGFQYCGSVGPVQLEDEAIRRFERIGSSLAAAFDLVGLFGVDAVVGRDGVWPVEVNPRFPASAEIHERATGFSPIEAHAAACQHGRLPTPPKPPQRLAGKAILFAAARLVIAPGWTRQAETATDLADIPRAEATVEPGWPVVSVLADGDAPSVVEDHLRKRLADVRERLKEESGPQRTECVVES